MALTIQQIHAVADELHKDGIKPTLANVRKKLGGGSFTTISDAMQSWREENKEQQQLQQVDLPSGISDRLQALGADLWQTAIGIANDRLSKERDALEVIKAKAQQDVDEYAESVKTLESEQKELLQQLDELNDIANTATADAQTAIAERDKLKEQLADTQHKLELANTATDTAQRQLDDTRTELDNAQAELTDKTSQVATLTANNNSKQSEIDRLKSELETSQSEIKELKAEVKTLNKEHNELNAQYAENKGELKAVKQERDNLARANDKLKATQQTAKNSLKSSGVFD